MLVSSINTALNNMIAVLYQLSDDDYTKPCLQLSNATIGEHTRHVIELFQCLEKSYAAGLVNYDNRKRDAIIQSSTQSAIQGLQNIQENLEKENKKIELQQIIDGEELRIESNYYRELLYNLEHCIHHQALIKVALQQCSPIEIDANFGVARSTLEYRNRCAQ